MASPSTLSVAARTLRTHLAIVVGLPESQILIGHPSSAVKDIGVEDTKQFLNLFFYRVEYGAYPADAAANDPFFVRLFCLITALGTKETVDGATISAGENDLRLVGGVMRGLHERPILILQNELAEDVAQLQTLLHMLSLDDLNHIWSTQGDTPYRLSVGYELALLPTPLVSPPTRGPRVGSIGVTADGAMRYRPLLPNGFDTTTQAPQVPAIRVDSERPDWVPHLCWLSDNNGLQYSLTFANDALPASLQIITLGAPGAEVELAWETWNPAAPGASWQSVIANPASLILASDRLDPRQTSSSLIALAQTIEFPLSARGQALLYASHVYTRPDGTTAALRSNPLLVSVYEAEP